MILIPVCLVLAWLSYWYVLTIAGHQKTIERLEWENRNLKSKIAQYLNTDYYDERKVGM